MAWDVLQGTTKLKRITSAISSWESISHRAETSRESPPPRSLDARRRVPGPAIHLLRNLHAGSGPSPTRPAPSLASLTRDRAPKDTEVLLRQRTFVLQQLIRLHHAELRQFGYFQRNKLHKLMAKIRLGNFTCNRYCHRNILVFGNVDNGLCSNLF